MWPCDISLVHINLPDKMLQFCCACVELRHRCATRRRLDITTMQKWRNQEFTQKQSPIPKNPTPKHKTQWNQTKEYSCSFFRDGLFRNRSWIFEKGNAHILSPFLVFGGMRWIAYFSLSTSVCIYEQVPYCAVTPGTHIFNTGSRPDGYIGQFHIVLPTTQQNYQYVFNLHMNC